DPETGSVTKLAKTTVSRGLHGTATLLPDASVFFAGENREALVQPGDPSFPLMSSYAGLLPRGDPDQGVPVGQVFSPPYLFKQDGSRAARPVIAKAPKKIAYRGSFDVRVAGDPSEIASVALLRSDHNTHSLTTGDRYVKLAFRAKRDDDDDERHRVKANLSGFQETPSTLSTPGSGRFTAKIDDDAQTIDYKLSYEGLEAPAIAAHIHLGARATSGGVSAFLCSGGNKPACPPSGGTVTGTITPADIIGPTAQ